MSSNPTSPTSVGRSFAAPARDYVGHGPTPPAVRWPNGARVAVSIVLNIEEGAERSVARGDAVDDRNGHWESHTTDATGRNLALESAFEYGSRAGIWRVLRILRRHEVRATAFACAVALELNPAVAHALAAEGHEIANHGYQWDEHARLTPEEEYALIARSTESLERTTGHRPRCWYSRDGVTAATRSLIRELGYTYDSNGAADDLPFRLVVDGEDHIVVPYAGDTNDSGLIRTFRTSSAFVEYLADSLEMLRNDPAGQPGVLSVGLHPRLIGRPAYAGALDRFIAAAKETNDVWFATRGEIADWWVASTALPSGTASTASA